MISQFKQSNYFHLALLWHTNTNISLLFHEPQPSTGVVPTHKLSMDYVVISDLSRLVEALKGLQSQVLESRDRLRSNIAEDKISNWVLGLGGLLDS